MAVEHGEARSDESGVERGKKVGFAYGNGVVGGLGLAGEGCGGGKDGVDIVPDGGGPHAAECRDNPWDEEAVSGGTSSGVFGGLLRGTCGDDT